MSVKTEYICDVCHTVKEKEAILAVRFKDLSMFKLVRNGTEAFTYHQGVHICEHCAQQIALQFPEIRDVE